VQYVAGYKVIKFSPFNPVDKKTTSITQTPTGETLMTTKGAPQVTLLATWCARVCACLCVFACACVYKPVCVSLHLRALACLCVRVSKHVIKIASPLPSLDYTPSLASKAMASTPKESIVICTHCIPRPKTTRVSCKEMFATRLLRVENPQL